jgi:hypothetical protein
MWSPLLHRGRTDEFESHKLHKIKEIKSNMKKEFDESKEILLKTLNKLPKVDGYLGYLVNKHNNNVVSLFEDKEDTIMYHQLMLLVIEKYEFDCGNYTTNGMTYKLNKDWDEIVIEYGGSLLLPFL